MKATPSETKVEVNPLSTNLTQPQCWLKARGIYNAEREEIINLYCDPNHLLKEREDVHP